MDDWSTFRPNLDIFGVARADPGWLYLLRNGNLFKIGKTRDPKRRLKDALTWSPDIEIVAVKPFWNISALERMLHEGFAYNWHKGEWFYLPDPEEQEFLIAGFRDFYEKDRDMNSVDFIYWYNGSGMVELAMERDHRRVTLRRFQRELHAERTEANKRLVDPKSETPPK